MKLRYLFFLAFIFIKSVLLSQEVKSYDIFVGAGNFDGIHVGMKYYIKNQMNIGFSLGSNYRLYGNNQFYVVNIFTEWNLKKWGDSVSLSRWFVNANVFNNYLEDKYYKWYFLTFYTGMGYKFRLIEKFIINVDVGPAFPVVLYNYRKTYETIGWPYHIQANFRIQFVYTL